MMDERPKQVADSVESVGLWDSFDLQTRQTLPHKCLCTSWTKLLNWNFLTDNRPYTATVHVPQSAEYAHAFP
jgi:hypothetical protein